MIDVRIPHKNKRLVLGLGSEQEADEWASAIETVAARLDAQSSPQKVRTV